MKALRVMHILIAASLVFMIGCATEHQVADSTVSKSVPEIKSMAVFFVINDVTQRTVWEDTFASVLATEGIAAATTYTHLPDIESLENDNAILEMYQRTGANSGLTIQVITQRSAAAMNTGAATSALWWAGLILDDPALRNAAAWGGLAAYNAGGKYQLRLSLWDAETADLIWSMDTKSFTNNSDVKDATTLAERAIKELRAKGLVY
jgi:hypothetical protein